MVSHLNKPAFHIVLLLVLVMAVSSCGRRGNLESPNALQVEDSEQTSEDVIETPKEDKPFILDALL